jgi:hypothetical protein
MKCVAILCSVMHCYSYIIIKVFSELTCMSFRQHSADSSTARGMEASISLDTSRSYRRKQDGRLQKWSVLYLWFARAPSRFKTLLVYGCTVWWECLDPQQYLPVIISAKAPVLSQMVAFYQHIGTLTNISSLCLKTRLIVVADGCKVRRSFWLNCGSSCPSYGIGSRPSFVASGHLFPQWQIKCNDSNCTRVPSNLHEHPVFDLSTNFWHRPCSKSTNWNWWHAWVVIS